MEHSQIQEIGEDQNSTFSSNESISRIQWDYEDSLATARNTATNRNIHGDDNSFLDRENLHAEQVGANLTANVEDEMVEDEDERYNVDSDLDYEDYESYDYENPGINDDINADVRIQEDVASHLSKLQFNLGGNTSEERDRKLQINCISSEKAKLVCGSDLNSNGLDSNSNLANGAKTEWESNTTSLNTLEVRRTKEVDRMSGSRRAERENSPGQNTQSFSHVNIDVLNTQIAAEDVNPLLLGLLSFTVSVDAKHSIVLTDYELKIQAERPQLIQDILEDETFSLMHKNKSETERANLASSFVDARLEEQRSNLRRELGRQKADLIDARRAEIEKALRKLGEKQLRKGKGGQSVSSTSSLANPEKIFEHFKKQFEEHRNERQFDNGDATFDPEDPDDPDSLPPKDDPLEIVGWLLEKKEKQKRKEKDKDEVSRRKEKEILKIDREPRTNDEENFGLEENIDHRDSSESRHLSTSRTPLKFSSRHYLIGNEANAFTSDSPFFPAGSSYTNDSREQANVRRKTIESYSVEVRSKAIRAAQRREELLKLAVCRADAERLVEDSIKNARRKTYYESFVPLLDIERSRRTDLKENDKLIDPVSRLNQEAMSELFDGMAHPYPTDLHTLAKVEKQKFLGNNDIFDSDHDHNSSVLPESRHNQVLENYNRYFVKEGEPAMSIRGYGNDDLFNLSDDELTDYNELVKIAGDAEQARQAVGTSGERKRRVHFDSTDHSTSTSPEKERSNDELRRLKHLDDLAAPKNFNASLRSVHRSRPSSARAVLRTSDPMLSSYQRLRPAWRSNLKHTALPGGVFGRPPSFGAQLDRRKRRLAYLLKQSTLKAAERGEVVYRGLGSGQYQDQDTPRSGTSLCATDPSFGCTGYVHTHHKPEWESRFNSPDVNMRVHVKQKMIGSPALRKGASEFDCRVYTEQGSHSARHVRNVWSGGVQSARDPLSERKGGAVYKDGEGAAAKLARASASSRFERVRTWAENGGNLNDYLDENESYELDRCASCGCPSNEACKENGPFGREYEKSLGQTYGCACGCGPVRRYCPPGSSSSTHPGTYLISKDLLLNVQRKQRQSHPESSPASKIMRGQYVLSKQDAALLLGVVKSEDMRSEVEDNENRMEQRDVKGAELVKVVEMPFFDQPLRKEQSVSVGVATSKSRTSNHAASSGHYDQNPSANTIPGISTKELVNKWLQTMDAQVVQQALNRARESVPFDGKRTDAVMAWMRPETPPAPIIEAETAAVLERIKGSSASQPYSFNYSYYEDK